MSEDKQAVKRASSVSGILVMCYDDEKICKEKCFFTCHPTDHCNDSSLPKVACVPNLSL